MIYDVIINGANKISIANANCFNSDFKKSHTLKHNEKYREIISGIKKPFIKKFFDGVPNPYNYLLYKEMILKSDDFKKILLDKIRGKSDEEKILICDILETYIITDTYIGFIVEHILAEALKRKGYKVHKNNTLDLIYKTDLFFEGKHFQIKNYSFLETSFIETKLKPYLSANRRLKFLFYTTTENGIYFVRIGNKNYLNINEINDFTQIIHTEKTTLKNFILGLMQNEG